MPKALNVLTILMPQDVGQVQLTTFISKMLIEEVLTASITAIYVNEKMHRTR